MYCDDDEDDSFTGWRTTTTNRRQRESDKLRRRSNGTNQFSWPIRDTPEHFAKCVAKWWFLAVRRMCLFPARKEDRLPRIIDGYYELRLFPIVLWFLGSRDYIHQSWRSAAQVRALWIDESHDFFWLVSLPRRVVDSFFVLFLLFSYYLTSLSVSRHRSTGG